MSDKFLDIYRFFQNMKIFHYLAVKCLDYMLNERAVEMDMSKVKALTVISHY